MEESKKIDLANRPVDEKNWGGDVPGCLFIFADDDSADKDLKEKFVVKDEEDSSK